MIIVCPKCNTSFLVPATLIKDGGKAVRCGKCKNVWKQAPLQKNKKVTKEVQQPISIKTESFTPPPLPPEPSTFAKQTQEPRPNRLWLFLKKITLARVALITSVIIFAIILFMLSFMLAAHRFVVKEWPITESFYMRIGWVKPQAPATLILRNIMSERRYLDGAMQLVVDGQIYNQSQKTQTIPDINVEAIGPDTRVIQSWRITPTRGKLKTGEVLGFTSAIIAPNGTVTEVNLNFIDQPHETE